MKFKPGDVVKFLNEKGGGVVTRIISQQLVSVAIEDGFEIPTATSELLKVESYEQPAGQYGYIGSSLLPSPGMPPARHSESAQPETENRTFSLNTAPEKPDTAIYLAFCPTDQKWLITGDVELFLLNPTEFDIVYSFNLKHPTAGWKGIDYDIIPPESGIVVSVIARDDLNDWLEGVIQILFHKETQNRLVLPVHAAYKLKMSRLLKEDNYVAPVFYHRRMILVKLTDGIAAKADASAIEGSDVEASQRITRMFERNESLIDRHRIAPAEAEVDLHISALREDYTHLSKHEILKLQIDYFRRTLDSAMMHQYKRIIYIHGIGNGVLRDAILQQLNTYEELQFRTAPFERYGYGAIEVLNPNPL